MAPGRVRSVLHRRVILLTYSLNVLIGLCISQLIYRSRRRWQALSLSSMLDIWLTVVNHESIIQKKIRARFYKTVWYDNIGIPEGMSEMEYRKLSDDIVDELYSDEKWPRRWHECMEDEDCSGTLLAELSCAWGDIKRNQG